MVNIFLHLFFSITFFYLINWIGRHSVSLGYIQLSIFVRQDEAPAFNFVLRIVSPCIFIVILSAILYSLKFDHLTPGIWRVVLYYYIFRAIFNISFGRIKLINWKTFLGQASIAVSLSFFVYSKIIITKINILPDFSTMTNELWLIIVLFLFTVFNRIKFSQEATRRRKFNYIKGQYNKFKLLFGRIIEEEIDLNELKHIIYAIMIFENFARPKIIRFLENLIPRIELTRGIMQVRSKKSISDEESVGMAIEKIKDDFKKSLEKMNPRRNMIKRENISKLSDTRKWIALRETIAFYNKDDDYIEEIFEIYSELRKIDVMMVDRKQIASNISP